MSFFSRQSNKEFSFRAMCLGVVFSVLFAISNAYLALKIGTTISASLPAAVLSMAVFRLFSRSSILENNIVQTVATVGEALACGVVFTIPALFFLNAPCSITKITLLSLIGGILGVLFMIPMRRFIIVEEHGKLPFPEGTACATVLQAGKESAKTAFTAFWGFIIAVIYKVLSNIIHLWQEVVRIPLRFFQGTEIAMDTSPSLLAVGYIVGIRISATIFSGSVLAWFVLLPIIKLFGTGSQPVAPGTIPIIDMNAMQIWEQYIRYIGAGTIAFGGIMSLVQIGPMLLRTIKEGAKELFQGFSFHQEKHSTEKDIPFFLLVFGVFLLMLLLWLLPFSFDFFTITILLVLGFFFSAVTSLTVGIVGSTSNPVSGMVITILLITCMLFILLGWTDKAYLICAITMSCVANITISMASTTSQDLKTGFLVGATPYKQQVAEIIGTILPSMVLGVTLYLLHDAYTIGSVDMPAPQASMIAMIAKGVLNGQLPYTLFSVGILIGVLLFCLNIAVLPFALGVYLPLSLTSSMLIGGIISFFVEKKDTSAKQSGILLASGMVTADACMGVFIALLSVTKILSPVSTTILPVYYSLIFYLFLAVFFGFFAYHRRENRRMQ